jgi:NADH:ubiquinone oxidoreductase subunit H
VFLYLWFISSLAQTHLTAVHFAVSECEIVAGCNVECGGGGGVLL